MSPSLLEATCLTICAASSCTLTLVALRHLAQQVKRLIGPHRCWSMMMPTVEWLLAQRGR